MSSDLVPLSPEEAEEMWLNRLQSERSEETLDSYRYRIDQFVYWCEDEGTDNLNHLTGRDIYQFDAARRAEDLAISTLNNQLGTLRQYLEFCVDVDAVPPTLPAKVEVPRLANSAAVNEDKITSERAENILTHLDRYEYASRDHVIFALMWHTTARLGAIHALDVEDCYLDAEDLKRLGHADDITEEDIERAELPFIYIRHRPESETELKNKNEGERPVMLSPDVGDLLRDYIKVSRIEATDDYGRNPLLSTKRGGRRMSKSAIRSRCNILTQPCRFGIECPHGRDVDTCEAREHGYESRCPSARSPHPIRTGAITHHIDCGWPPSVLAERVNATPDVIRNHYDHPEPLKRMESRRKHLGKLNQDSTNSGSDSE
ncbi:tyrosine-type recombinase/integrase [Halomarina salina]|uniref:Tyrosine-type recombinase/integrase n=1 Tax=Halomarina salina TaxID=1872699 RepID=A0ABD5RQK8_9EURY|nr:site-specific integrase [Halomarina salina]